ncbi:hypothetical protein Tco_1563356 [Tanacetum coccineum]
MSRLDCTTKEVIDIDYSSLVNSEFKSRANSWICYAIRRKVEEADLCLFDVGVGQGFTFEDKVFFTLLVSLLKDCNGYRRIDVTSNSVKKMVFFEYCSDAASEEDYIDSININAPYISSLTIKGELFLQELSVDLNEPKDSSKTDKAAQNGRAPKLLTLEIHHGGWFTPTPSRSYISGHVSSVNVVDIDEFWVHDLKYMVVKLGYGVEDLMYCHFLIPSLGLDYGLHSLNVDADVLEMLNSVEAPIVVECAEDPFEELDDLLGEYAHIVKQITGNEIIRNESTGNEIIGKQMVVHVGNSSTVDDVLELGMLFETEGVGNVGKFKEVEVDADNESEEESDTEGDYTMDSDSEDLDYDPKHDDVFDDDEHIVEEVHVNMNNFRFTTNPKHDTSIGGVDVQDDDLDIIDYDSVDSDLDDGIDSERRMQLRE